MGRMRRENKEDNLLFDVVFDELKCTMRLVVIKEKKVILVM
jgi:hypothetical protein